MVEILCPHCDKEIELDDDSSGVFACPHCEGEFEWNVDSAPSKSGGKNPDIEIVGVQPSDGAAIPGIRRWPQAYLPKIYDKRRVDRIIDVSQQDAESTTVELGRREGIFAGISSGGAVSAALQLSALVGNAVIVVIICDRGDRYLSTNVFPA